MTGYALTLVVTLLVVFAARQRRIHDRELDRLIDAGIRSINQPYYTGRHRRNTP